MSESKKLYVLNVAISLISPVRLTGEDRIKEILGIDKIPATMRALLAQEVIDRKVINPLAAVKKRVREALLKYGTREPLLGWVTDPERIDPLLAEIDTEKENFERAKQALLAGYHDSCRQHIEALREACEKEGMPNIEAFLAVVRGSQPDLDYLDQQIEFRYLKPRKVTLEDGEYEAVVQGVFAQTISDLAQQARQASEAEWPRTKAKALSEAEAKLRGLAYLDARFASMANEVGRLLEQLPLSIPNKEWDERSVWALDGVLGVLADRQRLVRRIEQQEVLFDMQVDTVEPALATPEPAATPVVELFPETKPQTETPLSKPAVPEPVSSSEEGVNPPDPQPEPEPARSDVYVVDTVAW